MTAVTVTALASCKDKTVDPETPVDPTPTVETYTATFKQDGQTLKVYTLEKGTQINYTAITPSKTPDANYTYTFKGWDYTNDGVVDSLPTISADIVFEAIFDRTERVVASHTVQVIDRGNVVYTGSVKEGESVTITGVSTPENYEDDTYTYTFAGWTYNGTLVTTLSGYTMGTSDMTFTAYYNRAEKSQNQGGENTGGEQGGEQGGQGEQGGTDQTEEFVVSFYNGTELYETRTTKGGHVTNVSISKNGYTFLGWTDASGNVVDVENTVFSSNTALYAKWEEKQINNYAQLVKIAYTEYNRPFTRTSQMRETFNGQTQYYWMIEEYVPNVSYERTVYKDASDPSEFSNDKIAETLSIIASTHTLTFNNQSFDYLTQFSSFNETFATLWQSDLAEGTLFKYLENSDDEVAYSYKFNVAFSEKVEEFSDLIDEKFETEKENFTAGQGSIVYQKNDFFYEYYEDEAETSFTCSYTGSTTGVHYYSYNIYTEFNDVN